MTNPKGSGGKAVAQEMYCEGCGVEVTWTPILAGGRRYCCPLCAAGGKCGCGYAVEDDEEEGPAIIQS
jgi:hypothetical protein